MSIMCNKGEKGNWSVDKVITYFKQHDSFSLLSSFCKAFPSKGTHHFGGATRSAIFFSIDKSGAMSLHQSKFVGRSLMNTENNSGPITEPCGTPDVISMLFERSPSRMTV